MRKTRFLIGALAFSIATAFSQVPPTRTHLPEVPFFLKSMDFRSMQMAIFPTAAAGMIEDPYSDLAWNPAFVLGAAKTSVYLTLNDRPETSGWETAAASDYRKYYLASPDAEVMASWVSQSSVSGVNTKPFFNLAAVIPLSSRLALSVMNRTLFDYAPFRSLGAYDWRDSNYGDAPLSKGETKRLSVDNDQQKMFGALSQISLGYRLSDSIDLGLRLGLLAYDRSGDLRDSDSAAYPHSSFSHLQSEVLGIDGSHLEAGLGLLWRLNEETRLGFYAGGIWGQSEDRATTEDRNDEAYENAVKPAYYRRYSNSLASKETHPAAGFRPFLTLTFEQEISATLRFRSFFSFSRSKADLEGRTDAAYASASDYTYDYYDSAGKQTYFRRAELQSRSTEAFRGAGDEKWTETKGFISLSYAPGKRWAVFGGLQIQRGVFDRTISESTVYAQDSKTAYSLYRPGTDQSHHSYDKKYERRTEEGQWTVTLPLGMKFEIAKGLYAVLGTDLAMVLAERHDRGDVLYHSKITRRWENGRLLVNDEEYDRAEVYVSDPPKVLKRTLGNRGGIVYEYNSHLTFHLRVEDNFTETADWAFGFELKW